MTHHLDWLDESECVEDMLGPIPPGIAVVEWAMSAVRTRAAAASQWSLLRVSSIAGIAIAASASLYFVGQLVRGAL